jgi:7-keto-8-aminopelargonate synthetase-like enzyme
MRLGIHGRLRACAGAGIYVIGFSFPVVPRGQARIRVQLSAAHETEHVDKCIKVRQLLSARSLCS